MSINYFTDWTKHREVSLWSGGVDVSHFHFQQNSNLTVDVNVYLFGWSYIWVLDETLLVCVCCVVFCGLVCSGEVWFLCVCVCLAIFCIMLNVNSSPHRKPHMSQRLAEQGVCAGAGASVCVLVGGGVMWAASYFWTWLETISHPLC